jgi:hypothetical protein
MLLLYAFCAVPFLMLGVIGLALVGKVREGRYRKHLFGCPPVDAPKPAAAVAMVMAPFPAVILVALATEQIGWLSGVALMASAVALSLLVYVAAAKRCAESSDQNRGT